MLQNSCFIYIPVLLCFSYFKQKAKSQNGQSQEGRVDLFEEVQLLKKRNEQFSLVLESLILKNEELESVNKEQTALISKLTKQVDILSQQQDRQRRTDAV